MNYRRGFLRAWIALTLVWIALAGSIAASDVIESDTFCNLFNPGPWCDHRLSVELLVILALVFGPPLALFAAGAGVAWIVAGFRSGGRRGAA
jgi:hypothetical protein